MSERRCPSLFYWLFPLWLGLALLGLLLRWFEKTVLCWLCCRLSLCFEKPVETRLLPRKRESKYRDDDREVTFFSQGRGKPRIRREVETGESAEGVRVPTLTYEDRRVYRALEEPRKAGRPAKLTLALAGFYAVTPRCKGSKFILLRRLPLGRIGEKTRGEFLDCLVAKERDRGRKSDYQGDSEPLQARDAVFTMASHDPEHPTQWGFYACQFAGAWNHIYGSPPSTQELTSQPVRIALIDSGIDLHHEELKNAIWKGGLSDEELDFRSTLRCPCQRNVQDEAHGHGTICAGIVAAKKDNEGIQGALRDEAEILPLKVLGPDGLGSAWDVAQAICCAVEKDVDIILLALGGRIQGDGVEVIKEALYKAKAKNILVVAAAGNLGANIDEPKAAFYPASLGAGQGWSDDYPNLLVVGGTLGLASEKTGYDESKASGSNFGKNTVDLGAPGYAIRSTRCSYEGHDPQSSSFRGLTRSSGTSTAASLVAGAAGLVLIALWRQANNGHCGKQIADILRSTADSVQELRDYWPCGRRLNVEEAVKKAMGRPTQSGCQPASPPGQG